MDRKSKLTVIMWLSAAVGVGGTLFAVSQLLSRGKADTIVVAAFLLAATGYFMAAVNRRKIKREGK